MKCTQEFGFFWTNQKTKDFKHAIFLIKKKQGQLILYKLGRCGSFSYPHPLLPPISKLNLILNF